MLFESEKRVWIHNSLCPLDAEELFSGLLRSNSEPKGDFWLRIWVREADG